MNPTDEKEPTQAVVPAQHKEVVVQDLSNKTWFRGVPPEDKLNRMYGFSKAICNAAFISPVVRGDEASVFYLVSMAEDLGAQWTHGLRSIYPLVKRGKDGDDDQIRAGIQGDLALALLLGRKFKVKIKESTEELCTVWMQRPDQTMEFEDSFTIAEAQKANLLGKPNWNYRKDMLRWRAIMRVARVVAADVLGGMYLTDEIEDLGNERGDHSDAAFQEQGRRNTEAEQSPFVVTEAPKVETPKPVVETKADEHVVVGNEIKTGIHAVQTKTEPEAAPAKRRGKTPTPEAAKEQLKASVEGFKATEDDLPEALQKPVSKESLPTALPQMERIQGVIAHLSEQSKKPADEVKKTVIKPFMTTFLGQSVGHNGPLPAPPNALYEDLLPILESLAEQYGQKLLADPGAVGGVSGTGWKELKEQSEGFSKDLREAVCSVAAQRHPDNPGDLITFMEDVAEFDGKSDPKEVLTFLKVYAITRMVLKLKEASMATGKTMTELVSKLDLGKATEADILAAAKMPEKTGDTGELWDEEGK